jgi:H+/gluconate symporter-like permease
MNLLWIEIPLALLALRCGWRVAPLLLVALPLVGGGALAHAFALPALAAIACVGSSQADPTRPPAALYQI